MSATGDIRPIKTEKDYERSLAEVERLMDAEPDTPEGDALDVLVTLIQAYEAKRWPIDPPDPIEAIRARMEQQRLRPKDLEPFLGTSGRVSEVLNRRRPLTLAMIRRLERGLGIPAHILIREPVGRRPTGRTGRKRTRTRATARRTAP
jgi:HTH-type transcriptional regulator/antitoxin HigA